MPSKVYKGKAKMNNVRQFCKALYIFFCYGSERYWLLKTYVELTSKRIRRV
jgi:hypothetical protein